MNLSRLDTLITVMTRVRDRQYAFSIVDWQHTEYIEVTEEDLHNCGMPACVGGWLAVSPEFIADGGKADELFGYPLFAEFESEYAIKAYLDCDIGLARDICGIGDPCFYNESNVEVTAADVVNKLIEIRKEKPHNTTGFVGHFLRLLNLPFRGLAVNS